MKKTVEGEAGGESITYFLLEGFYTKITLMNLSNSLLLISD